MAALKSTTRQPRLTAGRKATSPTNSKPIPTDIRPITGKTRSSSDANLDEPSSPFQHSPKRRRVEFDLTNNTIMQPGQSTSARKIARAKAKAEVERALADHANGDNEDYNRLKERFATNPTFETPGDDDDTGIDLRLYLEVLGGLTGRLNRSCDGLVKTILKYTWLDRDQKFVQTYTDFLANLLLTQGPTYTEIVFGMLVDKFLEARGAGIAGSTLVPRPIARSRLHTAIQYMLQNFPMTTQTLRATICSKYPFTDDSRRTHAAYVKHLLRLQSYAHSLRDAIMDLVIDRLLKLDVRMQLDLEDMDERTAKVVLASHHGQDNNMDDEESDEDSIDDDDEDRDEEAEHIYAMKSNIEKMDSILDSLFTFYTPKFASPDSEEAYSVYGDLLGEFAKQILPAYKSRHTQFLLFHFGQKSERLVDAFCGTCINIAFQSTRPVVVRQAAASYLASFVARGAHVPRQVVQTVFDVVGAHLDELRQTHQVTCLQPDIRKYATFYSLFQALLYIFCFRWKDLIVSTPDTVDEDDPLSYLNQDLDWMHGMRDIMKEAIYSKMNPMKVCAPGIVEQFAQLSLRLNFMYVNPLLASNKCVRLSQYSTDNYSAYGNGALRESQVHSHQESSYQLDLYFPFDPYQLPTSKRWVESDYVHWKQLPGMDADGDGDSDGDDESDQDETGGDDYEDEDDVGDTATDEHVEDD